MTLREHSLLLNQLCLFCLWLKGQWQESAVYTVGVRCAEALNRGLEESRILCFFRADWDHGSGADQSRFTMPGLTLLIKVGNRAQTGGGFAAAVRESVILRLLDERCLLFFLCVTGFMIPFAPTLLLLLLSMATFAVYALNILLGRFQAEKPGLVGIFGLLFALCYLFSTLSGIAFPSSLETGMMFLGLMLIMPAAARLLKEDRYMDIFLVVMLLSGTLVALYALYQYAIGITADAAWVDSELYPQLKTRAYSTFGNPNVMGEYLIPLICMGVAMLWKTKNKLGKLFFLGMTGIMALALLASGSRGAMLGLAFAALMFALIADHRLLPLLLVGVLLLPAVMPASLWVRFAAILNGTDTSSLYRVAIYTSCFRMLRDYWLTGIGVGSFSLVYPLYFYTAANSYHAHNLFLQVGLEQGVVGFSVFVLLLLFWFQRLYRAIPGEKDPRRFLTGALLGGMAGLLVQGMTDRLWFNYRIVLLFWLVLGMGLAAAGRKKQ